MPELPMAISRPRSMVLSFLGAACGLGGYLLEAIRLIRHNGWRAGRHALVFAFVAVGCVGPVFLFAGAGPGSWFQYCGT